MIPAFCDPQGRDSLGRGLDDASVRAAVRDNGRVGREREEQLLYVEAAYRDPRTAKARLDELVARDGFMSAARRIAAEPSTLGELQGRTGFLAGAAARAERARAETVAGALAENVRRVGEAEASAEQAYRASVEAQRRADAVPIPALSERAHAALQAIASARGHTARATPAKRSGSIRTSRRKCARSRPRWSNASAKMAYARSRVLRASLARSGPGPLLLSSRMALIVQPMRSTRSSSASAARRRGRLSGPRRANPCGRAGASGCRRSWPKSAAAFGAGAVTSDAPMRS